MKTSWRLRFGLWLERWPILHPVLFKYDGEAPAGRRCINRVGGHLVVIRPDGSLL